VEEPLEQIHPDEKERREDSDGRESRDPEKFHPFERHRCRPAEVIYHLNFARNCPS
jgi:hypothetical protein